MDLEVAVFHLVDERSRVQLFCKRLEEGLVLTRNITISSSMKNSWCSCIVWVEEESCIRGEALYAMAQLTTSKGQRKRKHAHLKDRRVITRRRVSIRRVHRQISDYQLSAIGR